MFKTRRGDGNTTPINYPLILAQPRSGCEGIGNDLKQLLLLHTRKSTQLVTIKGHYSREILTFLENQMDHGFDSMTLAEQQSCLDNVSKVFDAPVVSDCSPESVRAGRCSPGPDNELRQGPGTTEREGVTAGGAALLFLAGRSP